MITLAIISTITQASIKEPKLPNTVLHLNVNDLEKTLKYDYVMDDDLKLRLSLSQDLFKKPTGIFFDAIEISHNFKQSKNALAYYESDFNLKPGHHTLLIGSKTIDIAAKYVFDTKEHFHDINNVWNSRSEKFATLTKNGILLENNDRDYGSFAFKRFYCDNLTATFEFIPINFKPGIAVYFGDNIYFMINSNNILTMKKNEKRNERDIRIDKSSIPRIINGQLQTLAIERKADTYTVTLNGQVVTTLHDAKELKNQRYKNIGISIPKHGASLLIKKIEIK